MVQEFEMKIATLTDKHFPLQTARFRSNEDPWITNGIRKRAKRKKQLYNSAWKRADARLEHVQLQDGVCNKAQENIEP